ncbi:hypothetical protein PHYPSEUDO_004425 [Phytophthora pseudosyringae]|uniref:Transmembrane protein n=1 Tax=Phytophthora pseudosyringae TaxID=221518 RepID=A0A8T1WHQ7_9STRA|nr:hypothetical protein PHYPSEUDO_004425 [Phytophthora pseudosyringae]
MRPCTPSGIPCGFLPTRFISAFALRLSKRSATQASTVRPRTMNPASRLSLLLLALAAAAHHVASVPTVREGYMRHSVNIASVVSFTGGLEQANSSSSFGEDFEERLDFVMIGNDSISSTWLDAVAGYAVAADSKILYQTARWSLLEDGAQEDEAQEGKLSSFWARFQAVNSSASSLSVCAMVAEWNSSWKESIAALSAVDVVDRLSDKCGENDTIAVAFTSAVSETAEGYLEGVIAVNDAVAPFNMQEVESSLVPEAADRLFVRLSDGVCPRDQSAQEPSSLSNTEAPLISLFRGEVCASSFGSKNPQASSEVSDHKGSGWRHDLRFIVPVGVCVFLLGCAGLVYLLRKKKKDLAKTETTETPKEEEKQDPSSLPYVLSVHPV